MKTVGGILTWLFRTAGDGLKQSAATIDGWSLAKFIRAIEPAAILIAIVAFGIELGDRQEERTARAWQLLTTQAPGNSGKVEALAYLNQQDYWFWPDFIISPPPFEWSEWWPTEPRWWPFSKQRTVLAGINLTPPKVREQIRGAIVHRTGRCAAETFLVGVQLQNANLFLADLRCTDLFGANFERADLLRVNFERARIVKAKLKKAILWYATLSNANLQDSELDGADFSFAELEGVKFQGSDLRGTILYNANISGANLIGAMNLTQKQLDAACADLGNPPILSDDLKWHESPCP